MSENSVASWKFILAGWKHCVLHIHTHTHTSVGGQELTVQTWWSRYLLYCVHQLHSGCLGRSSENSGLEGTHHAEGEPVLGVALSCKFSYLQGVHYLDTCRSTTSAQNQVGESRYFPFECIRTWRPLHQRQDSSATVSSRCVCVCVAVMYGRTRNAGTWHRLSVTV